MNWKKALTGRPGLVIEDARLLSLRRRIERSSDPEEIGRLTRTYHKILRDRHLAHQKFWSAKRKLARYPKSGMFLLRLDPDEFEVIARNAVRYTNGNLAAWLRLAGIHHVPANP